MSRVRALLSKELADLRQNPGIFVPALLTGAIAILMPFFVAVIVPYATGERLSDSSDFQIALEMYRSRRAAESLDPEAAIQAWVFQQFLTLLVLAPVAGGMSVAAFSVIGEKQARTLEPILATPITTPELLTAKVLGAFVPSVALSLITFVLYGICVLVFARPGVLGTLFTPSSLAVVGLLGPLASLTGLQMAVCISSRVNDARTAQQIGAMLILPIVGLLVAQVMGSLVLTLPVTLFIALGLAAANAGLAWIGVALFDRESILTRWR
jgi:ABC-2 type transport system permease protein